MNRLTLTLTSFLAGAVTIAGAVMYADGRAAFMFVIGVAAVLIGQAALLGSAARIRRAGEFLVSFGEALETRKPATKRTPGRPELVERGAAIEDRNVIDIQSALVNFGAPKAKAAKIAAEAVAGGGEFNAMLRRAMQALGKAAA